MAASDARRAEARDSGFFTKHLREADPEISQAIENELHRQQNEIELIASENIVSQAVLDAAGTLLTNKYAEGYPGKRYYGGCQYVDVVEQLAIDRAKRLFNCAFANVQPHSGSQANQSVMLALIKPGDTVLGMSLAHGGHLTHGAPPNLSGKWFNAVQYGVRKDDNRIDYDEVERLAKEHKPALIIAGGSAYPRIIDFPRFRAIANSVGAYLMVDMAHFAGLVAGGPPSEPAAARPCGHHHHAQDLARTARRHGAVQRRGDRQEDQLCRVPRPPGRPVDAHHRRQGGRLRGSLVAGLQALHPVASSTTPRRSARRWSRAACRSSPAAPTPI